jgi:hypothetical protein
MGNNQSNENIKKIKIENKLNKNLKKIEKKNYNELLLIAIDLENKIDLNLKNIKSEFNFKNKVDLNLKKLNFSRNGIMYINENKEFKIELNNSNFLKFNETHFEKIIELDISFTKFKFTKNFSEIFPK